MRHSPLDSAGDGELSARLAERLKETEALLWEHMARAGLHAADGWRITQFTREREGGTELVLRPIHLRLKPPDGLECIVGIVEGGGDITSECTE